MTRWYQDGCAWRFVLTRYVPWLGALSLAWEIGHLPLYTLWGEADASYLAFAVGHCTAGDVLIGTVALLLALALKGEGPIVTWRRGQIAAATAFLGAGYTAFSEWINVTILRSWAYAPSMPTVDLGGFEVGLSPLAQWLVVPPLALHLAAIVDRRAVQ